MKETTLISSRNWVRSFVLISILIFGNSITGWAIVTERGVVQNSHQPQAKHADQIDLVTSVQRGQPDKAFNEAFELGDALFATSFNALDGGGANVGDGQRFTRVPRADLTGSGQWAAHTPARTTGPNAQACTECHSQAAEDGSGAAMANVIRDPLHSGRLDSFIHRNTPHLFGMGAIQRLAEEMTEALHGIRNAAATQARSQGRDATLKLSAKGIDFGVIDRKSVV